MDSFFGGGAPLGAPLLGGPGFSSTSPDNNSNNCTNVIFTTEMDLKKLLITHTVYTCTLHFILGEENEPGKTDF